MQNSILLKRYETARANLSKILENVTEEAADRRPEGFNNTIRWNVGHILLATENFLFGRDSAELPASYKELFGSGTKPADWAIEPPSLDTLKEQLASQLARIKEQVVNRLDDKLPVPFTMRSGEQLELVLDIFLLDLYHHGMHTGYIQAMKRAN